MGIDPATIVDRRARLLYNLRSLPIRFSYAVIDIETTGLDPHRDEMLGFGLVFDRYLLGVVRVYGSDEDVRSLARDIVLSLVRDGVPVYAWYKDFEERWLGVRGLKELQLRAYEKKDSSLSLGIPIIVTGDRVPELWRRWQRYRDAETLIKILWRAMYDAYIEAVSLYRKNLLGLEHLERQGMWWWI